MDSGNSTGSHTNFGREDVNTPKVTCFGLRRTSPLVQAARDRDVAMVVLLVSSGADPAQKERASEQPTKNAWKIAVDICLGMGRRLFFFFPGGNGLELEFSRGIGRDTGDNAGKPNQNQF